MSIKSNHSSVDHFTNTMQEDYHNSRYDDFQPGGRVRDKQQFRIIIRRLSDHLTKEGIINLCSNYGNVLDVHMPKTLQGTAFVIFSTSVEAETAVRVINEQPGQMTADFAKERKKEANPLFIKKDPEEFNEKANEYDEGRNIDMASR